MATTGRRGSRKVIGTHWTEGQQRRLKRLRRQLKWKLRGIESGIDLVAIGLSALVSKSIARWIYWPLSEVAGMDADDYWWVVMLTWSFVMALSMVPLYFAVSAMVDQIWYAWYRDPGESWAYLASTMAGYTAAMVFFRLGLTTLSLVYPRWNWPVVGWIVFATAIGAAAVLLFVWDGAWGIVLVRKELKARHVGQIAAPPELSSALVPDREAVQHA